MRNFLYALTLLTVICSCSSSPEDKANKLIKQDLLKSLYKPDTYKPVETKVDSAFAPLDSPEYFAMLEEITSLGKQQSLEQIDLESAESSMAIWGDTYSSEYGQTEYKQAKKKYDQAKSNIERYLIKSQKLAFKLLKYIDTKKTFIGWFVEHNYRADNNAGQTLIGNQVYIIDKDFNNIIYTQTEEEFSKILMMSKAFIEETEGFRKNIKTYGINLDDIQAKIDSLLQNGHTMQEIQEKGYDNI